MAQAKRIEPDTILPSHGGERQEKQADVVIQPDNLVIPITKWFVQSKPKKEDK